MKLLVVQYETAFSIELRDGWINSHPNCPQSIDGRSRSGRMEVMSDFNRTIAKTEADVRKSFHQSEVTVRLGPL